MDSTTFSELDVALKDGRSLHVFADPDESGELLVAHHGTPGSGLVPSEWPAIARAHGFRLASYDRAGYGASSPAPGRSVADVAEDIAALADALGHEQFTTIGTSGGGPHALACVALLPGRARAAITFAGVGPYGVDGLDFLAGMGQGNIEEFGAAVAGPGQLRPFLEGLRPELLDADPEQIVQELSSLLPPVDVAALTGEHGQEMAASMSRALRPGIEGWCDDDLAFTRPWGFDPAAISAPVLVVQGRQDLMVPFAHGQWLAAAIPTATPLLSDEDGHVSIRGRFGEALEWLDAVKAE